MATQAFRPAGQSPEVKLTAAYRLIAECFLAPEQRDRTLIAGLLGAAPATVAECVAGFLAEPRADDSDEYLLILELTPPCPLYLGHYIFEEPKSCRGAGHSDRNGYMIEIAGVYRHFGFELGGRELADFLPAMVEFLAISLEHRERDSIGLRRRFRETYMRPAFAPMRAALDRYDSPYRLLIDALVRALDIDAALGAGDPVWIPPARSGAPRIPPVLTADGRPLASVTERPRP